MQNDIEKLLINLYPESRFDALRFYIQQNCQNSTDLKNFDLSILYFVPGINIDDIPEIQSRFNNLLSSISNLEGNICEVENSMGMGSDGVAKISTPWFHIPVEFLLDQFKKGDLFARNVKDCGINFSSELTDLDFAVDKHSGIGSSSLSELLDVFHLIKEIMTLYRTLFIPVRYFIDKKIINFFDEKNSSETIFDLLYLQNDANKQQSILKCRLNNHPDYSFETLWNQLLHCYGYSKNSLDCKTVIECLYKTNKKALTGGIYLTKSKVITLADFLRITFDDCVKFSACSERIATNIWEFLKIEITNNSSEAFLEKPKLQIHPLLKRIPIRSFPFELEDKSFLEKHGFTKIGDLDNTNEPETYFTFIKYQRILTNDPIVAYSDKFYELNDKRKTVIVRRGKGDTLEAIAQSFINEETGEQVTRERIRQIETKAVNFLFDYANILALCLLSQNGGMIERPEVFDLFSSGDVCFSFFVCLREMSTIVKYFLFCDKFISYDYPIETFPKIAQEITHDIIGNYCHISEKKEQIEDYLADNNLTCFSSEDFVNYLVSDCGFYVYGDLLVKSRKYGYICHDIVTRFFDYDIKLDISDNNPDMDRLRSLALNEYGFELPDNRNLFNRLSSDTNFFCLCDRGRYIPVEKVDIDECAIDKINNYIKERPEPCLYYHEIFENLKGFLMLHSTITNRHYLHGAMMIFCPDEYQYGRDKLTKIGEKSVSIDSRVLDFLKQYEKPILFKDLKAHFEEFPHWVIEQVVCRQPNLVMTYDSYVEYFDYDSISENDCLNILNCIESILSNYHGFITGKRLFPELEKKDTAGLLEKYKISYWPLLVPIIRKYENATKIITRRAQFIDRTIFGESPSLADIFLKINKEKDFYSSADFTDFVEGISNSDSDYYQIRTRFLTEMSNRCCRISSDIMMSFEAFYGLFAPAVDSLNLFIKRWLNTYGFVGVYSIFNYDNLPKIDNYNWNSFLIETIINKCDTDYNVIFPSVRDFRYSTSIIVKKGTYKTYLEIVESVVKKSSVLFFDDRNSLGSFLIDHGLRYNISDKELVNSKILKLNSKGLITVNRDTSKSYTY